MISNRISWKICLWVLSRNISNNVKGSTKTRGQPTRRATARFLAGAPRAAASCFCQNRRRAYRSWDVLAAWPSPEAPRRQQRRGWSDRTSKRSRDLVGARVVCEANRDEKLGLRRRCTDIFLGAVDGLLCTRGRRTSRGGCFGASISREWWISPVKQSTTLLKTAGLLLRFQEHATSNWTNSPIWVTRRATKKKVPKDFLLNSFFSF